MSSTKSAEIILEIVESLIRSARLMYLSPAVTVKEKVCEDTGRILYEKNLGWCKRTVCASSVAKMLI